MHDAVMGALVGLAIAVAMFVFDYMTLRSRAAERAKRHHKTVVEFDPTDKQRIAALLRFIVFLPPAFALLFWVI
jgi:hypothetical protein